MLGLYVCPNGTHLGQCQSANNVYPNLTTTFGVYRRQASMAVARSNFSILSLIDIGPPSQNTAIDLPAFRSALEWLLDYNASGIPAPSSIAETFWDAQEQLTNEHWSGVPYQTMQSILAFPLWQFNENNFGNIELKSQTIVSSLPPEFYTKASIVAPYTRYANFGAKSASRFEASGM